MTWTDWSEPYCDTQHRTTDGYQATVSSYGRFTDACLLDLWSAHPYTEPVAQRTFFQRNGGLDAAKQWLDNIIRNLPDRERLD